MAYPLYTFWIYDSLSNIQKFNLSNLIYRFINYNKISHSNLKIKCVNQKTKIAYPKIHNKFTSHTNPNISHLASYHIPDNPTRRLEIKWCRGLINKNVSLISKEGIAPLETFLYCVIVHVMFQITFIIITWYASL